METLTPLASRYNKIPVETLKSSYGIYVSTLHTVVNKCLSDAEFPVKLKLLEVTLIFKKGNPLKAKNYRPISVLLVIPKVCERLWQRQRLLYLHGILSPYLCGYGKVLIRKRL